MALSKAGRHALSALAVALCFEGLNRGVAMAAPTVLDFEDVPPGTTITTQYGPRGVVFQSNFLDRDPAAHSGTQVLRTVPPNAEVFEAVPLVMRFTSRQARIKLFAASSGAALNGTLTAFDESNAVVAQDGPRLVANDAFTTSFEVIDPGATPRITRAELRLENGAHFAIDDLEFEGEAAVTPAAAPIVKITFPINGLQVDVPGDIPRIDIAGTVTGEGLVSPVTVTMSFPRPPESANLPPLMMNLDLTGSGATRQFSLPGGMADVPLGPVTVTVTAENTGGLKGTAASTFTNLPLAVRNRFVELGGAAALGDFRFGLLGECRIAVYERGAISGRGGGATAIRGDVFAKWLSLRGAFNGAGIGCPLAEERDALAGTRAQDFERGRIYARLPGIAPPATAYVPAVFVDAIDKRGGEAATGVPLADPTDSAGPMRTWLFQRFFRPDRASDPNLVPLLPSTLEIRGTPPRLWMERQGGNWLHNDLEPSIADKAVNKTAATVWESFPCSDNLGPCSVQPEPPFPPPNIADAGQRFCGGRTYIPGIPSPPEWKAIKGDYVATPLFGVIVSAHMADIDNGLTHETHNGNCPYLTAGLAIGSPLLTFPVAFGTYVAAEEYGVTCISDYEFRVRPVGPQVDTSPLPSLFGKENGDTIWTEYEEYYASAAHKFLGAPAKGDLVHATGRWIIDCGHPGFKSELHPLFSFARMKTVVSETNTSTGLEEDLFGGRPATRVAIWVNGWYPGGANNAIELEAFPPPRPSPNAVLTVTKPVDSAAGGYRAAEDVTLDFSLEPALAPGHVHFRFTAPSRQNVVTDAGEMMFEPGRQYWGIWYLYWSE